MSLDLNGPRSGRLSDAAVERSLRLSLMEGLAFALMVGFGEVYLLADAIRLSSSRLEQCLIVTLPLCVGSIGSLFALRIRRHVRGRKPIVVAAAIAQAVALLALGIADGLGVSSPTSLIVGACAYHAFGQTVGASWASWFAELVPAGIRGSYFARRNRGIYVMTCVGLFGGGWILQAVEPAGADAGGGGAGFAWIFCVAAGARLVSVALHAITPEPVDRPPSVAPRFGRLLSMRRGGEVGRLIFAGAALQFVVYVGSPFFAPHMLEGLHFSYLEYTVASVIVVTMKVLFLPAWGRAIDQSGPRSVFLLCVLMLSLVPLPWILARGLGWVLVAQGLSGLSWAGFELSVFCLLIEASHRRDRAHVFALQSVMNGAAQLAGGLAGALIVTAAHADLRLLFAISLAGRLLIALRLPRHLSGRTGTSTVRRGDVLLRVIGMRPSGGLALRAMEDPPTPRDSNERR